MNAQQLATAIKKYWFVNGSASWSDDKVTTRDVEKKLAAFRQVSRSLGIQSPFKWDDGLEAAEIISNWVNSSIDEAKSN